MREHDPDNASLDEEDRPVAATSEADQPDIGPPQVGGGDPEEVGTLEPDEAAKVGKAGIGTPAATSSAAGVPGATLPDAPAPDATSWGTAPPDDTTPPDAAVRAGITAGHDSHGRAAPARPTDAARRVDAERRSLMRLRRHRLFLLLGTVPVTFVLAVLLGGTWVLAHLLVDAGLVAYCLHLRRAARAERRLRASRAARDRWIAAERAARAAERTTSAYPPARGHGGRRHAGATPGAGTGEPQAGASVDGDGDDGEEAGAAGWWDVEYSPIRLSDTIPPIGSTGVLNEAELAAARAETVDLAELMSKARGGGRTGPRRDARVTRDGRDARDDRDVGTEGTGGAVGAETPGDRRGYSTAYGGRGRAYGDDPEYGGDLDTTAGGGNAGATRAPSGRTPPRLPPVTRPSTSKPGRVQVNPPNTQSSTQQAAGRPIASPPPAAGAAGGGVSGGGGDGGGSVSGGEPVQAGEDAGGAPDGADPLLLRRRAVGH